MFNFSRLQWFHPLVLVLLFALSLERIQCSLPLGRLLVAVLIVVQLGVVIRASDSLQEQRRGGLSFREFYSPQLFA